MKPRNHTIRKWLAEAAGLRAAIRRARNCHHRWYPWGRVVSVCSECGLRSGSNTQPPTPNQHLMDSRNGNIVP